MKFVEEAYSIKLNMYKKDDENKEISSTINNFITCYAISHDSEPYLTNLLTDSELDELYNIGNDLFGNVVLEYKVRTEYTETGWNYGIDAKYEDGFKIGKEFDYNYEDYLIRDNRIKSIWEVLKDEIEEKAEKENIEVDWEKDDYNCLQPSENMWDICDAICEKHHGIEEIATKKFKRKIKKIQMDINEIQDILNVATLEKYEDVINIINKTFNVIPTITKEKAEQIDTEKISELEEEIFEMLEIDSNYLDGIYDYYKRIGKEKYIKMVMNDRNFIMEVMKLSGASLRYLDDKYKDDLEIVKYAVTNDIKAYEYASERLKNNREIIELVENNK